MALYPVDAVYPGDANTYPGYFDPESGWPAGDDTQWAADDGTQWPVTAEENWT